MMNNAYANPFTVPSSSHSIADHVNAEICQQPSAGRGGSALRKQASS
jgi:hypothetical protein